MNCFISIPFPKYWITVYTPINPGIEQLNDEKLQFVESYKYLGAKLDNLLDFELHEKTTFKFLP